jgi:ketosteroid isomerase-like protein
MAGMTNNLKTGHALARRFEEAWNSKNLALFDEIFHPEMIWHVAVSSPGESQRPPYQSKLLNECGAPWPKTIFSRQETIDIFSHTFRSFATFAIRVLSITAEDDRVAVEAEGNALHANGRRYDNHYCYIFQIRDAKIFIFREYQDTLLVFDVNFVA